MCVCSLLFSSVNFPLFSLLHLLSSLQRVFFLQKKTLCKRVLSPVPRAPVMRASVTMCVRASAGAVSCGSPTFKPCWRKVTTELLQTISSSWTHTHARTHKGISLKYGRYKLRSCWRHHGRHTTILHRHWEYCSIRFCSGQGYRIFPSLVFSLQ